MSNDMKFIDLCCGIGGFHTALRNLGMTCSLAADIDEECRKTYLANYNVKPVGDLRQIDVEKITGFDVLCAGFPCQPFSKAGHQQGFDDTRGSLFFDICKIIQYHKPKYILLENVRNLATHDKGNTWRVIKSKLKELKYSTYEEPVILNTLYFGVPQSRERVVIMCKRLDLGQLPTLPDISRKLKQNTSLESIMDNNVDEKYSLTGKMLITHTIWDKFLSILNTQGVSIPKFPIWTDWWDSDGNGTNVTKRCSSEAEKQEKQLQFYIKYKRWIDQNRTFYTEHKHLLDPWLAESRSHPQWSGAVRKMEWQVGENNLGMDNILWSPRGSGVRVKKTNYAPTLVAMTSMIPIYGPKLRSLTPRECARLQSFPDTFHIHENDKTAYKQFGNAVNVTMIERCARFLINGEPLFL